jgi:hypothetical protein
LGPFHGAGRAPRPGRAGDAHRGRIESWRPSAVANEPCATGHGHSTDGGAIGANTSHIAARCLVAARCVLRVACWLGWVGLGSPTAWLPGAMGGWVRVGVRVRVGVVYVCSGHTRGNARDVSRRGVFRREATDWFQVLRRTEAVERAHLTCRECRECRECGECRECRECGELRECRIRGRGGGGEGTNPAGGLEDFPDGQRDGRNEVEERAEKCGGVREVNGMLIE